MSRRTSPPAPDVAPTEEEFRVIRAFGRRRSFSVIAEVQGVSQTFVEDTLTKYRIFYPEDAHVFLAAHDSPRGEAIVSTATATKTSTTVASPNGAAAEPKPLVTAAELAAGVDALDLDFLAEALSVSVDSEDPDTRQLAAMLLGFAADLTGRARVELREQRAAVEGLVAARVVALDGRHAALSLALSAVETEQDALRDVPGSVRLWAAQTGTPCPSVGDVPPRLVRAWLVTLPPVGE